jgi:competence protein CoiA
LSGYIEKLGVVIEVQASALSIPQILSRMRDYSARQCFVLWIVPLKDGLGSKPFLPRLYERFFHSIYFGRTYYWLPGDGATFRPIHYGVASRWIDEREWYDVEEGVEKSAGGYNRPYVIVKQPMEGTQIPLSLKTFQATWRTEFVPWNTRKAVPRCRIMRDKNREWWNKAEEAGVQPDYYRYS